MGGQFEWLVEASSTNSLLLQKSDVPHFSVLATDNQVAGRGRAGRSWQAPAGASLAISILVRPKTSGNLNQLGWLPLLAGLAMSRAVNRLIEKPAGVKWPNDVLVNERKISGVLSELLPDLSGVVIGAGLNLTLTEQQLPVPTATSLAIEGAGSIEPDAVLSGYLREFENLYTAFAENELDANRSGLRQSVIENCLTLGREVRAILPGDLEEQGRASTIDDSGRLVLEVNGQPRAVAAGDIVHMRHN
jgi:BirA family biotin operon repressor/biotin-[acetyl-CoA-carboxylase] ligase